MDFCHPSAGRDRPKSGTGWIPLEFVRRIYSGELKEVREESELKITVINGTEKHGVIYRMKEMFLEPFRVHAEITEYRN